MNDQEKNDELFGFDNANGVNPNGNYGNQSQSAGGNYYNNGYNNPNNGNNGYYGNNNNYNGGYNGNNYNGNNYGGNNYYNNNGNNSGDDPGPWKVFAIVGFSIGIVAIVLGGLAGLYSFLALININSQNVNYALFASLSVLFFIYGIASGVPAIVFSVLGLRSTRRVDKAKTGLILSVVGTGIAFVSFIMAIAIIPTIATFI